jgi:hypothetical protein
MSQEPETRKHTYSLGTIRRYFLMSFMPSFMNAFLLALALGLAPPPAGAANSGPGKVSFYFAAHEDDWQLFMNLRHLRM